MYEMGTPILPVVIPAVDRHDNEGNPHHDSWLDIDYANYQLSDMQNFQALPALTRVALALAKTGYIDHTHIFPYTYTKEMQHAMAKCYLMSVPPGTLIICLGWEGSRKTNTGNKRRR